LCTTGTRGKGDHSHVLTDPCCTRTTAATAGAMLADLDEDGDGKTAHGMLDFQGMGSKVSRVVVVILVSNFK